MATKSKVEIYELTRGQRFWIDGMHFEFIKMDGMVGHATPLNEEALRAVPRKDLPAWIPLGLQVEVE